MKLLADRFKRKVRGLNSRALTERDFYVICEREGIYVAEDDSEDMKWNGIYTIIDGVPVIIIKASLRGLERLWTMFHELGHHFMHTPSTCFFSAATLEKHQSEANAFAAIALIPVKVVRQIPLWELYDIDEFSTKLFQIRLEIFALYKV